MALVATVMKIWDSTSNNEIIVLFIAKGLARHRARQNIAYLVFTVICLYLLANVASSALPYSVCKSYIILLWL